MDHAIYLDGVTPAATVSNPLENTTRIFDDGKLYTFRELQSKYPISRTTVWREVREGRFPQPIPIGPQRHAWFGRALNLMVMARAEAVGRVRAPVAALKARGLDVEGA